MWRILVIGLIAAVVALQEDSDDGSKAAGRREAGKGTVKALGRVLDENGTPIAGATIRVAVPAADMRLVPAAIRSKKPGEKVVIEVLREVQEEQRKIRLPTTLDEY